MEYPSQIINVSKLKTNSFSLEEKKVDGHQFKGEGDISVIFLTKSVIPDNNGKSYPI